MSAAEEDAIQRAVETAVRIVDTALKAGNYESLDRVLAGIDPGSTPLAVVVAYVVTSRFESAKLPSRPALKARLKEFLLQQGEQSALLRHCEDDDEYSLAYLTR